MGKTKICARCRMRNFGVWPWYTPKCQADMLGLLDAGGTLSAYRSNRSWGVGPREGSWANRFERELEKTFGVKHAVAVNSGTMALVAAIRALRMKPGSIVTTPYSFSATPASIILAGHKPVFADVNPDTYNIDYDSVKKVITRDTRAILPVDLFGLLADYDGLSKFGVPIVRDGCQSVGASREGKYHFGDVTCASGNGTKNCPVGEGGWTLTNDAKVAERIRLYISHEENFGSSEVGVNGRMPEMSALVAYHGLKDVLKRNDERRRLAWEIWCECGPAHWARHEGLYKRQIVVPYKFSNHALYVYPFTVHGIDRSLFIKRMAKRGVQVGGGYITPTLDQYPAFKKYRRGPLPVVKELSEKTLCLLSCVRPPATVEDMQYVGKAMEECLRG